jgi:DNA-binding transcriptional MerR regulator
VALREHMVHRHFTRPELAWAAGMSIAEVRDWQERGLLAGPRCVPGRSGDVAFYQEHVDRLIFIRRALTAGFAVDQVARLADTSKMITCDDVYRMAEDRLRQLREEHGDGLPIMRELERLMARCSRRGARTDCAILRELSDRTAASRSSLDGRTAWP